MCKVGVFLIRNTGINLCGCKMDSSANNISYNMGNLSSVIQLIFSST